MSKPKLFSSHVLFDGPRRRLAEHFDVEYWSGNERPPRPEVLKRVAGKDVLICLLTERVDRELLDAAGPSLQIVANVAVGYDNIDVAACTERKVAVTNTPAPMVVATTIPIPEARFSDPGARSRPLRDASLAAAAPRRSWERRRPARWRG